MNQHYVSLTVQVQPIESSHLKLMIVLDNNLLEQSFFFKYSISHLDVFCKESVLKNFPKFTGKHLRLSLFFNKDADLRQKRLCHMCITVNFANFLKAPFFHKAPPMGVSEC